VVFKEGNYIAPKMPGYSIEIKKESLELYDFNSGAIWKNRKPSK
jgi:L-fuconate dehydratase